jgi:hypothetical protein
MLPPLVTKQKDGITLYTQGEKKAVPDSTLEPFPLCIINSSVRHAFNETSK